MGNASAVLFEVYFFPQQFLHCPSEFGCDFSDIPLGDWVMAVFDAGQEEDLFLDFRGEECEVHYLCDAGACDAGEAGDFGVVSNGSVVDQFLDMDCERHEAGNTRDATGITVLTGMIAVARFSFSGFR